MKQIRFFPVHKFNFLCIVKHCDDGVEIVKPIPSSTLPASIGKFYAFPSYVSGVRSPHYFRLHPYGELFIVYI